MVTIKKVEGSKELRAFIRFNYWLYKDNKYAVPDFLEDLLDTFNPEKNAAYDFCEAQLFLAYRDKKIVGRVAAIINNRANEKWGTKNVRFGWIDFIDDEEVSKALLDTVEAWGKERGMDHIVGPLGFTDMDPEGMLVEGFDRLSSMSTIYNYPYYQQHVERLGFEKETDWVQGQAYVPSKDNPADMEKYYRVAEMSKQRYHLRLRKFKNGRALLKEDNGEYVMKVFGIVNKTYGQLFGYSEMSERQMRLYTKTYLQFMDTRLLSVVEDEKGEPIAMGAAMASMATALQKAKGKLFPFGWWHLLKALYIKHAPNFDVLLIGVLPEYQNKGVNGIIFADIISQVIDMGFKWCEIHPTLETNNKSIGLWAHLNYEITIRRRCYQKTIK